MHAIILSIGDELALGQTVDTNAAWLSARLAGRGVFTQRHETVADDRPAIAQAIRRATEEAELVISTGGLGPTDDDLTRFALADVLGVELERDASALAEIASFFQRRGRTMNPRNIVQAMCPRGATMLTNPAGTAPGIAVRHGRARAYFFPGVPREMHAMWERHVLPALPERDGAVILTTTIHTFGKGESDIAAMLGDLMARDRNPTVGTTVSNGVVAARIRSVFPDADTARGQLDDTAALVERALGTLVFGRDETDLAAVVGRLLTEAGKTLVTAESCTGGMIGQMLTARPGASDYYPGGWVVYSNDMKHQQLGVRPRTLEVHGAVSEAVAVELAEGARRRGGADYAVSVTGVAGPTGGTDAKPVGLVCFGLDGPDGATSATHHFPGDRPDVRLRSALFALNMVRLALLDASG